MKKLLKYMKGHTLECVLAPLFKMIEATFELLVPLVVANMIDMGISEGDNTYLIKMSLVLAALGALGFLFSVTAQYFAARAAVSFAAVVRSRVFGKIHSLSFSQIDKVGTSTLVTRITGDVNTVQNGVNLALRLFLRSPFIVFGAAVMAYIVDKKATIVFLVTILILAVIVYTIMFISMPLYKKVQGALDKLTLTTRESLGGARVVRAFGMEEAQKKKFAVANNELNHFQKFAGTVSALTNPLTFVILNGAIVWLIYSGAVRVETGAITVGAVVALYNYMSQILVELVKLANLIVTLTKGVASGGRISAILDMEDEITDGEASADDVALKMDNVSFSYNVSNEPALKNISFEIRKGETLGIIGGTGSGKTTFTELLGAYYLATEGEVSVFGLDVSKWDKNLLREKIAYVPQKAVLFIGSVRDNLRWGNEGATDEELFEALKAACAYDFVMEKDGALDYNVIEGGKNFSGGQRQRLSIARALVKKAPVLILDDSASALDMATEAKLRANIKALSWGPAVVTVSQRTSSVMHCDKIIVLDEGEAVGIGKHSELLENCAVYKEIYDSQFGGAQQ
ncbi:MAG: ABC transporter ATP-binding protein [Clostridia bacterium]|nr:ABC transporter ATP-binding protein [Clostridia bacterium]